MKFVLQRKNFGLGNFIMLTSALQLCGEKVNVYFSNKGIKSLYINCPFINIISKLPSNKPFITSRAPKRLKGESDSQAYCRMILKRPVKDIPNTYVDRCTDYILERNYDTKYVALFHGCLGKIFRKKKDIGAKARQMVIDKVLAKGYVPVILGSNSDVKRYWSANNLNNCVNYLGKLYLRESVSVLNQCDFFISNDTGLYHAAGALEKSGLVMWHQTNLVKNRCVFDDIECSVSKDRNLKVYCKAVDNFLELK